MFKLKKGNVIEKLNKMDRKQAYTFGGIVLAVMVALVLLASLLGNAEDPSMDGFASRGYDLANSPFITDEAEEALLASKYPDMQENRVGMIYTEEEKEARQEEDAAAAAEEEEEKIYEENETAPSRGDDDHYSSSSSSGGYGGYRGGGSRPKTEINTLNGSLSMARASGSGTTGTYGGPRADNTAFKERNLDTGKNQAAQQAQLQKDAKRSLAQFAQGSRAAAGLKESRDLHFKQAAMGGDSKEAGAFREDGTVDLSQVDPSKLDTNAPQTGSPDLSSIKDKVKSAAEKAKDDKKKEDDKKSKTDEFLKGLMDFATEVGKSAFNTWFKNWSDNNQTRSEAKSLLKAINGKSYLTEEDVELLNKAGVGVQYNSDTKFPASWEDLNITRGGKDFPTKDQIKALAALGWD